MRFRAMPGDDEAEQTQWMRRENSNTSRIVLRGVSTRRGDPLPQHRVIDAGHFVIAGHVVPGAGRCHGSWGRPLDPRRLCRRSGVSLRGLVGPAVVQAMGNRRSRRPCRWRRLQVSPWAMHPVHIGLSSPKRGGVARSTFQRTQRAFGIRRHVLDFQAHRSRGAARQPRAPAHARALVTACPDFPEPRTPPRARGTERVFLGGVDFVWEHSLRFTKKPEGRLAPKSAWEEHRCHRHQLGRGGVTTCQEPRPGRARNLQFRLAT